MVCSALRTDGRPPASERVTSTSELPMSRLLIAALPAIFLVSPSFGAEKPNIVFILTDDQGYADLGCYGAKDVKTPNVDRIAQEGTRFTSFYVAQPVCTASRSALLTGCYSNRVSMAGALNHTSTVGISAQETLLSELCQKQGM